MSMVLKAQDAIYGGYVLGREDGIVFIRGAIPGELVEVVVQEKRRDYTVASVTQVVEPSEQRVEPLCQHFGICGGCHLQFASYEMQVKMKDAILLDCLKRIGKMEPELAPALFGEPYGYRRRAQFKVSREGLVGFYREGSRDVVPIKACPLMSEQINEMCAKLPRLLPPGTREVHLTHGDGLIAQVKGASHEDMDFVEAMKAEGAAGVTFEDGTYYGQGEAHFDLDGIQYAVSARSFFQSNWALNVRLASQIMQALEPLEGKRILDLYAGGGNFSLLLAKKAAKVVAVEENASSIKDGLHNCKLNSIENVEFIKATAEGAKLKGVFDAVLLDPPRPGLTSAAFDKVAGLAPYQIVYVSCNPSTLARDLRKFSEHYELESIGMVDFFPNTYHVEAVAVMKRRIA